MASQKSDIPVKALTLMKQALEMLDAVEEYLDVAAHLDLATHRLEVALSPTFTAPSCEEVAGDFRNPNHRLQ